MKERFHRLFENDFEVLCLWYGEALREVEGFDYLLFTHYNW